MEDIIEVGNFGKKDEDRANQVKYLVNEKSNFQLCWEE